MSRAVGGLGSIRGILASRARSQAAHKFCNCIARAPHSTSFGQTLQFITSIKLEELEKQRLAFKAHAAVIDKAAAVSDDPPRLLLDAVRSWRGSGAADPSTLLQARKDPGFSPDVVKDWADTLETHIRHSMTRFEFAKLFGGLFFENS
ncbi:hypothetical protein B0H16DRAFT_1736390 [Mycena metata]|uniref:Uncharacterized protein n=1 Tax=Mycena metata TaxID=1033252 RepID=A0AAD7HP25_9AGAR|nr:hypothetical protein B0H16DRAFT_1736390 [Mycena metata]